MQFSEVMKQKLIVRDTKIEQILQISLFAFNELKQAFRDIELQKGKIEQLQFHQEDNSLDKKQLENLVQRQMTEMQMFKDEIQNSQIRE